MSLVGKREEFRSALNTVYGVVGYAYRPRALRAGDAWPLLGPMQRGPGNSFDVTWNVYVALPGDEKAASTWIDDHLAELLDALTDAAFVDRVEPVNLATSDEQPMFGLMIQARSE